MDLFVYAMLVQICYQDPNTKPGNFQLNYNKPNTKNSFFFGNTEILNITAKRLFDPLGYIITQDLKFLDTKNENYRVFIGKLKKKDDEKESFIISIRGTSTFRNIITDLEDLVMKSGPDSLEDSKVVASFYNTYESNLKKYIFDAISDNIDHIDNILVLGHSLGGPYAAFTSYDILQTYSTIPTSLYTYNSPRFCNKILSDTLNEKLEFNIRNVNNIEAVSTLPPRNWIGEPYHTGMKYLNNINFINKMNNEIEVNIIGITKESYEDNDKNNLANLLINYGITKLDLSHLFYVFGAGKDIKNTTINDNPYLKISE